MLATAVLLAGEVFAIEISNRYRSPRNPERSIRKSTELIVLHTTEAPAKSSLNKVSERGECHFVVTEAGSVYRIVDRDREAFHAGRSMWRGKEDVDKFSVGIECVGYHNKPMGIVQIRAIAALVKELKAMYRLSDDKVVCHSHVAYGAPNKWQRRRHRGRKRCGMLFAMPSVRRALGLSSRPGADVDTAAGRLTVGDPYLQKVLYGRVDTMTPYYGRNAVPVPGSASGGWLSRLMGTAAAKTPSAQPAARPKSGTTTQARAPAKATKVKTQPAPKSIKDLKARGYVAKGSISKTVTAKKIAGDRWNAADTFYTIRNQVLPGTAVNPARLEAGTTVWMRK